MPCPRKNVTKPKNSVKQGQETAPKMAFWWVSCKEVLGYVFWAVRSQSSKLNLRLPNRRPTKRPSWAQFSGLGWPVLEFCGLFTGI